MLNIVQHVEHLFYFFFYFLENYIAHFMSLPVEVNTIEMTGMYELGKKSEFQDKICVSESIHSF